VLQTVQFKIIMSPQVVNPVESKCFVTIETDIVLACSVMLCFTLVITRNSFILTVAWKMLSEVDGNRQN